VRCNPSGTGQSTNGVIRRCCYSCSDLHLPAARAKRGLASDRPDVTEFAAGPRRSLELSLVLAGRMAVGAAFASAVVTTSDTVSGARRENRRPR
jgi:hypothetical protein